MVPNLPELPLQKLWPWLTRIFVVKTVREESVRLLGIDSPTGRYRERISICWKLKVVKPITDTSKSNNSVSHKISVTKKSSMQENQQTASVILLVFYPYLHRKHEAILNVLNHLKAFSSQSAFSKTPYSAQREPDMLLVLFSKIKWNYESDCYRILFCPKWRQLN